ncbi:hypothetical protein [Chitinimonas sp. BJB300]|uniref:hypothetical protein n=1 Tax=Chitinimonas sp. BJB300 TaxID=1559339 RepID=UPI000C0F7A95|nr:hypothetical protein [Chitinimonas sp. BJB300]PHV09862.1 hypothetical protein CSQ89_19345 [Chitinimonas sp. BJB300]TSJ87409.1 hypothetical protein FG002_014355 [Chitinimonas sp. BJB300]
MQSAIQNQSISRPEAEDYALPFVLVGEERLALFHFVHVHSSLDPETEASASSGLSLWLGQDNELPAYLAWHWQYAEGIGIYIPSMDNIVSNLALVDGDGKVLDVHTTAFKWWLRVERLDWRIWAEMQLGSF